MQDDLNTVFSEHEQEKFGLHRGKTKSESIDFAKKTRKASKMLDSKEKAVQARESAVQARETDLDQREADLLQRVSESLSEARSELDEVRKEKDMLEVEIARKRAERAKLDGMSLDQRDKAVLNFMKNTISKNVPGKTLFEVVDGNRQKADDERLLKRLNDMQSGISSNNNQGYGLER